jgi:uroporphyrinogen decarboxylase
VAGGVDQWKTLKEGTPEQAVAQTDDALAQTSGRSLIVAAGCVLPMETPDATVAAVVRRLGGPLKMVPGATR